MDLSAANRLIAAYQEAALRLTRALQEAKGAVNRRIILRRVDEVLSQLDALTADFITQQIPIQYKAGSEEAIKALQRVRGFGEIDQTFGTLHTKALQQLANDATLRFANALEAVKRESRSLISTAQKQEVIGELIASEIEGAADPAERVQQVLEEQGIVALQGATRKWTLENYAAMLSQTVLAEANNTGALMRYVGNGVEYAEVIEQAQTQDITCRTMRGKVVWLGDPRLIPPYHPYCRGSIKPFMGNPENAIMGPDDPRIPAEAQKMMLRKG